MKLFLKLFSIFILVGSICNTSFAQNMNRDDGREFMRGPRREMRDNHMRRGHGPRHEGRMLFGDIERMKERLNLSDKQIDNISKINITFKKSHLEMQEKMSPKKIKLKRLLLEESIDLKKVRALLKELSDLRVEVQMLRIKQRIDIEKQLTKEQRRNLKKFKRGPRKGRKNSINNCKSIPFS
jgi:Spy/CpxP family protein refolding chaperone